MARKQWPTCDVVEGNCQAPPALEPQEGPIPDCFACGMPVCKECSGVVPYRGYGRQRIGFNCMADHAADDTEKLAVAAYIDFRLNGPDRFRTWEAERQHLETRVRLMRHPHWKRGAEEELRQHMKKKPRQRPPKLSLSVPLKRRK